MHFPVYWLQRSKLYISWNECYKFTFKVKASDKWSADLNTIMIREGEREREIYIYQGTYFSDLAKNKTTVSFINMFRLKFQSFNQRQGCNEAHFSLMFGSSWLVPRDIKKYLKEWMQCLYM